MDARPVGSRAWGLLAAAVLLALPLLSVPASTSASTAPPVGSRPPIDWAPCGADFPGLECATLEVPLDYDRPRGATTTIALARKPASDQARRIGSVFVNPGGPGGSGVGMVLSGFGEELDSNLDGRFDIVGFDPRGVGASDPLHCFDSEEELGEFFADQPVFPYLRAQYRPWFDRWSSLAGDCLGQGEAIARHMSTADVVRDLDVMRRAVGDRKLSYLGFSYGSYLGTTYAALYPRKVRALVVDGVLDPRLWSSGRQVRSDRIATQEEFDEFLRLCHEAGPDCAFGNGRWTAHRWERLARTVEREPIDLGDGFLYTYDFLINDAASAMYVPEFWGGADGYAALFDLLADAALGDQSARAATRATRAALVDRLEADYDNFLDAYFGNQCADSPYPDTFRGFRQVAQYAREGSRFGPFWWWFNNGCADWPVAPDRFAGPWRTRTSSPVLVVGNYFDGVTDYRGARAVNRLLTNSALLSYAGWGHTAYGRSACTTAHVDRYLLTGALPPRGTVCPANPNPFVTSGARLASRSPDVGLPPTWMVRPNP